MSTEEQIFLWDWAHKRQRGRAWFVTTRSLGMTGLISLYAYRVSHYDFREAWIGLAALAGVAIVAAIAFKLFSDGYSANTRRFETLRAAGAEIPAASPRNEWGRVALVAMVALALLGPIAFPLMLGHPR